MFTNSKLKAFTLMEILIATAIFAMVMVIAVGTFTWAAGYNNRLKESRRVGQEIRSAMDDMTRTIRLANGSGQLTISSSYFIGEITFLKCTSSDISTCALVSQTNPFRYTDLATSADPSGKTINSNAVLILNKNDNKATLYRSVQVGSSANYILTKTDQSVTNWLSAIVLNGFNTPVTLHPDTGLSAMSMQVWFGGYGQTHALRNQQPYAEIYIIGQTLNYGTIQPNMRAKFHLRTMVESRDYNP